MRQSGRLYAVRLWHILTTVALAVISWLVIVGAIYGRIQTSLVNDERRIEDLEKKPVVLESIEKDWRDDIKARLERIEEKLDRHIETSRR